MSAPKRNELLLFSCLGKETETGAASFRIADINHGPLGGGAGPAGRRMEDRIAEPGCRGATEVLAKEAARAAARSMTGQQSLLI